MYGMPIILTTTVYDSFKSTKQTVMTYSLIDEDIFNDLWLR